MIKDKLMDKKMNNNNIFKTFSYFCFNQTKTDDYLLNEIVDNKSHEFHNDIMYDLQSLHGEEFQKFVNSHEADPYVIGQKDIDLETRKYYFLKIIRTQIAVARLGALMETDKTKVLPYCSGKIRGVQIDDNNLIEMSSLKLPDNAYFYNDYVYRLCPTTTQDNSSHWLGIELTNLLLEGKKISIRLDPFFEILRTKYESIEYREMIYGKQLRWEKIKSLKNDADGQFFDETGSKDYSKTDYLWHINHDKIHFTCEELPTQSNCEYRGSRYFHAIFDKINGKIIHCDGALRVFDGESLNKRLRYHIKNPEATKMGKRIKLFLINDTLDNIEFSLLGQTFFKWNDDLRHYFMSLYES